MQSAHQWVWYIVYVHVPFFYGNGLYYSLRRQLYASKNNFIPAIHTFPITILVQLKVWHKKSRNKFHIKDQKNILKLSVNQKFWTHWELYLVHIELPQHIVLIQYPSDTRYKACVNYTACKFGDKRTCTLRQIHVYTKLNLFIQGDKRVYTRRQTRLPYAPCIWQVLYIAIYAALHGCTECTIDFNCSFW